jgi:hypothetical protein
VKIVRAFSCSGVLVQASSCSGVGDYAFSCSGVQVWPLGIHPCLRVPRVPVAPCPLVPGTASHRTRAPGDAPRESFSSTSERSHLEICTPTTATGDYRRPRIGVGGTRTDLTRRNHTITRSHDHTDPCGSDSSAKQAVGQRGLDAGQASQPTYEPFLGQRRPDAKKLTPSTPTSTPMLTPESSLSCLRPVSAPYPFRSEGARSFTESSDNVPRDLTT